MLTQEIVLYRIDSWLPAKLGNHRLNRHGREDVAAAEAPPFQQPVRSSTNPFQLLQQQAH